MGQVLSTFRSALGTAVRSPMHLTVVIVVGTAAAFASVVIPFVPLVGLFAGPLVNGVLLTPLVLAALLGSARAARNGENAWNGAQSTVEECWTDLVGAYGLVAALWVFVGGAIGVLFLIGALGLGSLTEPQSFVAGTTAVLVALPFLLVVALVAVAGMVLQFVAPAAVVAGTDAVESLKTAVRFSLANPLGVVGFSLVALGVGVAAALPGVLLGGIVWYFDARVAAAVILVIGYLEAVAVAGSVTSVYLVTYFEAAVDASDLPEGHPWPGSETSFGSVGTGDFEFGNADPESERR